MFLSELFRLAWGRRERRKTPRMAAPALLLDVSWRRYPTLDWSLGGCRIAAARGAYRLGDRIEGTVTLKQVDQPKQADQHGEFLAEVMHLGPEGELGLRWLELSADILAAMTDNESG